MTTQMTVEKILHNPEEFLKTFYVGRGTNRDVGSIRNQKLRERCTKMQNLNKIFIENNIDYKRYTEVTGLPASSFYIITGNRYEMMSTKRLETIEGQFKVFVSGKTPETYTTWTKHERLNLNRKALEEINDIIIDLGIEATDRKVLNLTQSTFAHIVYYYSENETASANCFSSKFMMELLVLFRKLKKEGYKGAGLIKAAERNQAVDKVNQLLKKIHQPRSTIASTLGLSANILYKPEKCSTKTIKNLSVKLEEHYFA